MCTPEKSRVRVAHDSLQTGAATSGNIGRRNTKVGGEKHFFIAQIDGRGVVAGSDGDGITGSHTRQSPACASHVR